PTPPPLHRLADSHGSPSIHPHPPVRHFPDIEQLILQAQLPRRAEVWSLTVFRKLAEAEGAVHGVPPEQVHFHEVGATDALVDIIGTCLGLDWLGIDRLYCSALPTGGGCIRAAHGRLPVPTPAVLKLFEMGQVPIYSNGIEKELVTPTGAAIATTLATQFGPPPPMILHKVGLGAGSRDLSLPNILRLWIGAETTEGSRFGVEEWSGGGVGEAEGDGEDEEGEREIQNSKFKVQNSRAAIQNPKSKIQNFTPPNPQPLIPNLTTQAIAVLETQIDDLNPQAIAYVLEVLLEAGALDVFTQAIGMKKSRPGVLLTVICQPEDVARCEVILFRETTTLGIRRSLQERQILPRELQSVETAYGPVRVKVAWAEGRDRPPTNVQPEYEDCAQLARSHNQPWRQIQRAALESWYRQNGAE
ncbi:nickel pincer cofactor biosynthesis protein LarC, partial [Leptodesmis sp.]|uniref:nickel pincer cofactor biosynthesis protein LarC n=1 Tax=Leptodesmis sp. TaxID=3100501 RepID=UPI0040535565